MVTSTRRALPVFAFHTLAAIGCDDADHRGIDVDADTRNTGAGIAVLAIEPGAGCELAAPAVPAAAQASCTGTSACVLSSAVAGSCAADGEFRVLWSCGGEPGVRSASGHGTVALSCAPTACGLAACSDGPSEVVPSNGVAPALGELHTAPASATAVVVSDAAALVAAAGQPAAGVIYVADDAVIDLTGMPPVQLRPGTVLMSGRGHGSVGALLQKRNEDSQPMLQVAQGRVRITGLRLQGPDLRRNPLPACATGAQPVSAIRIGGGQPTEVDNNEIFGWTSSGVRVAGETSLAHIHDNHIHHNQYLCLGYGIHSDDATSLIEGNLFDHNKHDIASRGNPGARYQAHHNVVGDGSVYHLFDVHDDPGPDGGLIAGEWFLVHDNAFFERTQRSVMIRQRPTTGAWVFDNLTAHASVDAAFIQVDVSLATPMNPPQNFVATGNLGGQAIPPRWSMSSGGQSTWALRRFDATPTGAAMVGDFDGDGADDLLRVSGGKWSLSSGAFAPWVDVNASQYPATELAVGDFDGDGTDDVFHASGTRFEFSAGARAKWAPLTSSTLLPGSLRIADVDADGVSDVLASWGGQLRVSWGGRQAWTSLASWSVPMGQTRVGDFDGDGCDDLLSADGAHWTVARCAAGFVGEPLNTSALRVDAIRLGDFDGNGRTDVIVDAPGRWDVSWNGASAWTKLGLSDVIAAFPGPHPSVTEVALGDFDGDGRTDLLAGDAGG